MTSWFRTLSLLSMLVLTGCASNFKSTDVLTDQKSLNEKAIVITRVHAPFTNLFGNETDVSVNSTWKKVDASQNNENKTMYRISRPWLLSNFTSYAFHEHMVEPGRYELTELFYQRGNVKTTILPAKHTAITFTVKPGEVVYIGDLQVHDNGAIKIEDHFDAAVKYFKEQRPEIIKPVEKRLIQGSFDSITEKILEELKKELDRIKAESGKKKATVKS